MSTDDDYIRPAAVSLTSAFENAKSNTFSDVSIFVPGDFKSNETLVSLGRNYSSHKIEFRSVDDDIRNLVVTSIKKVSVATYYRLKIASFLPNKKKCLYLDADVILGCDLSELYETNLDSYYIAGVRDPVVPVRRNTYHTNLGVPDLSQYISAGVLLFNLEKMREDKLEDKFSAAASLKTISYADQDLLNLVCYGKILCLPIKFNYMVGLEKYIRKLVRTKSVEWEESRKPCIVHFILGKTWVYPSSSTFHKEFWDYAKKTGNYDEEIKNLKVVLQVISEKEGEGKNSKEKKEKLICDLRSEQRRERLG